MLRPYASSPIVRGLPHEVTTWPTKREPGRVRCRWCHTFGAVPGPCAARDGRTDRYRLGSHQVEIERGDVSGFLRGVALMAIRGEELDNLVEPAAPAAETPGVLAFRPRRALKVP